ncbi:MAG: ABC transporter ATP-binding protein [Eubacterium sp.]|nr:ABC transporter ATP-binding protein [Eubacterium sp.]
MSSTLLQFDNVTVKYGDFTAVSDVTMSFFEGSIIGLIGTNGAGKTSLMNAAMGLTPISSGKVSIAGEDITEVPVEKKLDYGMCLVPQGGHCFNRMSVQDNLLVGGISTKSKRGKENYVSRADSLEKVYDLFPVLKEKANVPAGSLSGGQRQMVAIGRALMSNPRIILFDELSLGLAPVVVKDIYATIRKINETERTTIILIEQDTNRVLSMTDYAYIMLKGQVALEGDSDSLDPDEVKKAYFGI